MSNDFGIGDSKQAKNQTAKKGRRAPKEQESTQRSLAGDETEEVSIESFDFGRSTLKNGENAKPNPSRRGGWGAESVDLGKSKPSKDAAADYEDERLRAKTPPQDDDDSDVDIPVIPELKQDPETDRYEDQVAIAPHVVVNRVATYKELDSDLIQHTGFLSLDNEIDLKLLSKALYSQADINEDDVAWEPDHLFTEVSSELLTEWDATGKRPEE